MAANNIYLEKIKNQKRFFKIKASTKTKKLQNTSTR